MGAPPRSPALWAGERDGAPAFASPTAKAVGHPPLQPKKDHLKLVIVEIKILQSPDGAKSAVPSSATATGGDQRPFVDAENTSSAPLTVLRSRSLYTQTSCSSFSTATRERLGSAETSLPRYIVACCLLPLHHEFTECIPSHDVIARLFRERSAR